MRFGGPVFGEPGTPEAWVAAVRAKGYRAAYCPVGLDASAAEIGEYRGAASENDIVIAEVGAWSNPLSNDPAVAAEAERKIIAAIRLADEIGAKCCVNIAGSVGPKWDGPAARDLTRETFDRIVVQVREFLAEADPQETFYGLEPMPWMYPDSAESYRELIEAVDHPRFAVHYDPVNLVSSPQAYFANANQMSHFIDLLGDRIVAVHAKDITLRDQLTTHLDEVIAGEGCLDYVTLLRRLDELDPDLPLMLEHLDREEQYDQAARHIRGVAQSIDITL